MSPYPSPSTCTPVKRSCYNIIVDAWVLWIWRTDDKRSPRAMRCCYCLMSIARAGRIQIECVPSAYTIIILHPYNIIYLYLLCTTSLQTLTDVTDVRSKQLAVKVSREEQVRARSDRFPIVIVIIIETIILTILLTMTRYYCTRRPAERNKG